MPVLREVVTRFKFETDDQAARKVDQRVNKMKRGIGGIGKVLGIGLSLAGAKALFSFGQSGIRAKLVLDDLAGTEFKPLRQSLLRIKKDLDAIKTGAGGIFTEREYNIAAAGFIRTLGTGEEKLKLFDQIFRSAAKQSGVTGQNIVELTQQLTQAVSGGDFSALLNLPGIDQAFIKRTEYINELFNIGAINEQVAIDKRAQALSNILEKFREQQNRSLKKVPFELFQAQRGEKLIEEKAQKTAESIIKISALGITKINDKVKEKGFIGAIQDSIRSLRAEQKAERKKRIEDLASGKTTKGARGEVQAAIKLREENNKNSIIFNSTINVKAEGDPVAIVKEIKRVEKETFNNALNNIIPTEDR